MSLESHAAELHPVYRLFQGLTEAAQRQAAAELLDYVLAEQIPIPEPFQPAPETLPVLRDAVKQAHPDRKAAAYLLANISHWSNPALLESLPALAPAVLDLGDDGMKTLLEAAVLDPRTVPAVAAYAMTNKAIIRAAATLALHAARNHQIADLQRLTAACPAEKMEESKDAERLFPAVAAVADALPLAAALAARNISSARGTCLKLAKISRTPAYLSDFRTLVEAVGIQAIGFCLGELHRGHGDPGMRNFVAQAAEAARQYGTFAGQAFLERKTPTARAAFSERR